MSVKRLNSLVVTQTRILRADDLPFIALQTPASIAQIQKAFDFRHALPVQPPIVQDPAGGVSFWAGAIEVGSVPVALQQITIETRKITMVVGASSSSANLVYERLVDLLRQMDSRDPKPELEPIVLTQETATVVEMDFPITRLFEDGRIGKLAKDMDSFVEKVGPRISIVPAGMSFRVSYLEPSDKLKANNIQLADKNVKIELRVNTAAEENLFFIASPNSSEIHMKLLEHIEEVFAAKR